MRIFSLWHFVVFQVVSNGVLNGPQHQQQQQLASSMASFPTFPGTHHPLSHSLKSSESAATVSEFAARFIANGTGGPPGSAYLSPGTTTTANKQTKGLGTGGNSWHWSRKPKLKFQIRIGSGWSFDSIKDQSRNRSFRSIPTRLNRIRFGIG